MKMQEAINAARDLGHNTISLFKECKKIKTKVSYIIQHDIGNFQRLNTKFVSLMSTLIYSFFRIAGILPGLPANISPVAESDQDCDCWRT